MKLSTKTALIILGIGTGLIFTQACGSKQETGNLSSSTSRGSTEGVTISNEVSSPAEMNVGDIIMLQFSASQSAELDFSGVDGGSQYYLAVGSLDTGYSSHTVSIQSDMAALETGGYAEAEFEDSDWDSWTTQDAFSQRLRDVELALSLDPELEMADSGVAVSAKAAMVPKSVGVGDTEEFRVLNSLSSLSSYRTVTGRVKCVMSNTVIYLDTEVESTNPDDLTGSDIDMLCENFNEQIALERGWFGEESDVDGDGKAHALLTPQVNRLGSMGGGIITGFFLASDLYARSGSNSISNEREIVYALVPDTDGDYGTVIPRDFAIDNLLTAVLPHELQHCISYNQHVFEGEGAPESNWLNEGLSHFTEDLVGYGQENFSRVEIYLSNTGSYQVAGSGSPGLGERGAAYLFVRFLYEQHPDPETFLWGLYHNDTNGVANVEEAYNGTSSSFDQFGEFFMRWMVAVAMTNRGLSADPRYVFRPRTYNASTERWQGICLICDADDGRGTSMTGPYIQTYSGASNLSLYSSSARFYDVSSAPAEIAFSTSSADDFGAVLIRSQ